MPPQKTTIDIYSPSSWRLIWKTVVAHERVWAGVAARTSDPAAVAVLRSFFKIWDPVFTAAIGIDDFMARGSGVDEISEEEFAFVIRGLATAIKAAQRIGLGRDRRGIYHPTLDPKMLAIIADVIPPSTARTSGETMTDVPAAFRASITGQLDADQILTLSACHGGRCYKMRVDLKPIANDVAEMIRRYHAHVLHGDMRAETISGLGDWYRDAVRTAARIANAKAARKLWSAVQRHHGKIEGGLSALGPLGAAAAIGLRTGLTVNKMLTKARRGDPTAVDDVRKIVALSKQGDPGAKQVHSIMRNLTAIARKKGESEASPIGDERIAGWLWNRPYRVAAVGPGLALRGIYNLGLAS